MIACDGCQKTLQLEDLQIGRARELDGLISCWECLPKQQTATQPDALVCDGCGGEIPLDYLRRGLAVIKDECFLCTRCKIQRQRKQTRALDARLIASALLLFIVLPITVGLVVRSVQQPAPDKPPPSRVERPGGESPLEAGQPVELFNQKLARKDRRITALGKALAELQARRAREQTVDDLTRLQREIQQQYQASFRAELASKSSDVRLLALLRMAEIGDRRLAPLVLPLLGDPAAPVRALAAKLLGVYQATHASSALLRLLGDDDRLVQQSAARALARITGRPLTYFAKRTKGGAGNMVPAGSQEEGG